MYKIVNIFLWLNNKSSQCGSTLTSAFLTKQSIKKLNYIITVSPSLGKLSTMCIKKMKKTNADYFTCHMER